MFDTFERFSVTVGDVTVRGRAGGSGPPLLLLHGNPQTHVMWHQVAPGLAGDFTVVAPDLPGYGDSDRPADYSKRATARTLVGLMSIFGFAEFLVAGHDRGGRAAYRAALDHPHAVRRLAVLDIVPTADAFDRVDGEVATALWRWFLMAQPAPLPETLIAAAPEEFFFGTRAAAFRPDALAEYRRHTLDPAKIHAMCEDYRAGATTDRAHDEADRGRRTIDCPVLVLWGKESAVDRWYDVPAVWRSWAGDVRGGPLPGGHYFPEESPDATREALRAFFTA